MDKIEKIEPFFGILNQIDIEIEVGIAIDIKI